MVKRAKTPEAIEEAKYYTCWKPYPNNADFELSSDYITFCRWIVQILGNSDMLHAIYYKPKANGMVIFAVDKTYPRPERLLGEHRWSEFLKKPGEGDGELVSKIYYSTYGTDREAQKDGWKCIPVENFFFANFGIGKRFTEVPYPAPHWCEPPRENLADKPLCRPLPKALTTILRSPQPFPSAPPKPGSTEWAQVKQGIAQRNVTGRESSSQQKPPPGVPATAKKSNGNTGWNPTSFPALEGKPAPKKVIPGLPSAPQTTIQSVWGKRSPAGQSPSGGSPRPSALSPPPTSTAHKVWADKPSTSPPTASTVSSPASPAAPHPARITSQQQVPISAPTATPPPAAPASPVKAKNQPPPKPKVVTANVVKPAKSAQHNPPAKKDNPPPAPAKNANRKLKRWNSSSSSSGTEGSSTASAVSSAPSSPSLVTPASVFSDTGASIDLNDYDYDNDYDDEVMEEIYDESWETASVHQPSGSGEAPSVHIGLKSIVAAPREELPKQEAMSNLWLDLPPIVRPTGSVSAAEAWANENQEVLCPIHGGKCKRGICEGYKKALRKSKMEVKKKDRVKVKQQRKEDEKRKKQEDVEPKGNPSAAPSKHANRSWADDDPNNPDSDLGEVPTFGKGGKPGGTQTEQRKADETSTKQGQADQKQAKEAQPIKERGPAVSSSKDASITTPKVEEQNKEDTNGPTTQPPSNVEAPWDNYDPDDSDSDISEMPSFIDNVGQGRKFYDDEDYED